MTLVSGAGPPRWEAAVLVPLHGLKGLRSAMTVCPIVDVKVPAFYITTIVFGGVVGGVIPPGDQHHLYSLKQQ